VRNETKKEQAVFRTDGGVMSEFQVFVDKQTGVNYLYVTQGYGGGVSVLVDRAGKSIVTA
jgi:hypothetical protein